MRVGFLSWGDKVYNPGVKVTLDLAQALGALGAKASIILVQSSPSVAQEARRRVGADQVRECKDLAKLPEVVRELSIDVLYSKDHIDSVRALAAAQEQAKVRSVAFTSGFYALEALRPPGEKGGTGARASSGLGGRFLSYPQVSRRYRELLRSLSGVVSISYYCEMLVELLYGIRPLGVVYPIVDASVYHPPATPRERSGVLVFAGPAGNRDVKEFLPTLRALPASAGTIHLFGAEDATRALHAGLGEARSRRHVDLSERELVELYGKVRATYITSEWEGFGYVGPESLLCGTPVVAEVAQPWMELTGESDAVRISRSRKELVDHLSNPPPSDAPTLSALRLNLAGALSPTACGSRLLRALTPT